MEVDELDTGLVEQFGSLQTVDHADLVRQMRRLVGADVSESYAKFYLEMSNWNVHAAVGHYFDLNGSAGAANAVVSGARQPSMTFVRDVTIGEGESVPPATYFTKTWAVCNSGQEAWPSGCSLNFTHGERLQTESDRVDIGRCLNPGENMDISLRMKSPSQPGIYEAQWRMATPSGAYFGDTIWVILTVEPSGTMALTQQMDKFQGLGHGLDCFVGTPPQSSSATTATMPATHQSPSAVINPFASPPRPLPAAVRPSSPTDSGQEFVSARNILERSLMNPEGDEDMN